MKKLIVLFFISITFYSTFAQKNFQTATIETIDGQSKAGEIDYREWKSNPKKISFRENKSSKYVVYGVSDLSSFSVAGDVYRSAVVQIIERSDNLGNLAYIADSLLMHTDTVFLQTIVSGPKSLYSYSDNVNHFYIPDGKNGYQFLAFSKVMATNETVVLSDQSVINNTNKYVVTKKGYISQLKEYLNGCPGLNVDGVNYDAQSLRNAFISYYDCLGTKPEHVQKAQNDKLEIGILAGVSQTTFAVNTANNEILERVPFKASTGFTAGASFDIVFPRQRGRLSLNNELMYSSYATEGTYRYVNSPSTYDDYFYKFGYSYIKLNNMLRYKFITNSVKFFVNGGITTGVAIKEVNTLNLVHDYNGYKVTRNQAGYENSRKYEIGMLLGVGARKNRASIEVRAEKSSGPFQSSSYKADVMRYTALLGYRLK